MHAGQVNRRPLTAMHFLDRLIVILQAAHAHGNAARLKLQLIADAHAATGNAARDHGAVASDREGAVDGQPERAVASFGSIGRSRPRSCSEGRTEFLESLPRYRADA